MNYLGAFCFLSVQFVEASDLHNFHLLGLSLGGLVSAAYATQHGDRIASLTLMCPPGELNNHGHVLCCTVCVFVDLSGADQVAHLIIDMYYYYISVGVHIKPFMIAACI